MRGFRKEGLSGCGETDLYTTHQRLRMVGQSIDIQLRQRFLDVGCADGYAVFWVIISGRAEFAVGLDMRRDILEKARSTSCLIGTHACTEFIRADAKFLPFRDLVFERVLSMEVLEHILDWKKAVAELVRVSNQDLVITTPSCSNPFLRIGRLILHNPEYERETRKVGHVRVGFDVFELVREIAHHGATAEVQSFRLIGHVGGLPPPKMAKFFNKSIIQELFIVIIAPLDRLLTRHVPFRFFGCSLVLTVRRTTKRGK